MTIAHACGAMPSSRSEVFSTLSSDEANFVGVGLDDIAKTHGMRMFARDMGNGVWRVISPALLPVQKVRCATEMMDMVPIQDDEAPFARDLSASWLTSIGVLGAGLLLSCPIARFARPIDDTLVEMTGWLPSLATMV